MNNDYITAFNKKFIFYHSTNFSSLVCILINITSSQKHKSMRIENLHTDS